MCKFFSCIATKAADVLFCELTSHEVLISRSGLQDNLEHFVRVEYTDEKGYRLDEQTIPEWYERIAAKVKQNVIAKYIRIQPLWAEYDKIKQSARANYIESVVDIPGYIDALEVEK